MFPYMIICHAESPSPLIHGKDEKMTDEQIAALAIAVMIAGWYIGPGAADSRPNLDDADKMLEWIRKNKPQLPLQKDEA
jgi:hypothetical protein